VPINDLQVGGRAA